MNKQQKQRLSEIRQGAEIGLREGYLRVSGIKTLPAQDIDVLLERIDDLEMWIHVQEDRIDVCTFSIFGELCDGCRCGHRNSLPNVKGMAAPG
ncbi:MAG: hypothetical protein ABJQ29_00495 [Luteolibacter sp.]